MKSNSTINSETKENIECLIMKVYTSFINLKVGVSLDNGAPIHFASLLAFLTLLATFQAKKNVRSVPASSALTLILHQSHNARSTNRHLRGSRKIPAVTGSLCVGCPGICQGISEQKRLRNAGH